MAEPVGTILCPIEIDGEEDDAVLMSLPPSHDEPSLKPPSSNISEPPQTLHQTHKDEEDVCFVCYDGGDLILCDTESCPKAYHVDCAGIEDKYFNGGGSWYCGWHKCAFCEKAAVKQCFTCPHAICNNCCSKFLVLRKGKGLCKDCFMLVSMIEQNLTTNSEGCEVDFTDVETSEYLFKAYWNELKKKLSITWIEVDEASQKQDSSESLKNVYGESDQKGGDDACQQHSKQSQHLKKRRKTKNSASTDTSGSEFDREEIEEEEEQEDEEEQEYDGRIKSKRNQNKGHKSGNWASKKLVKFLQDIGEDSEIPLSLTMVKKLVWKYVEKNKLVNAQSQCKVKCDEKLYGLFQKKYVQKHDMMKSLNRHVASKKRGAKRPNTGDESDDDVITGIDDKMHKHKKACTNLDDAEKLKLDQSEYAAIDLRNINLIYLKRSLLDALREDPHFESKVLGSFVRIRVPNMGSLHRLVQVIGIKKMEESSNSTKMSDIILEVLNLQKHEEVTVDAISRDDFTEKECEQLQQCVKAGFLKAMTVGQLKEKALALQEAKVKDWIKNELLRLGNLRDRASEKGRKKELREYVEKIQALSSLAEQERQLKTPIVINVDPHMNPEYESKNVKDIPANGTGDYIAGSVQNLREKVTMIDSAISTGKAAVDSNDEKNSSAMDDSWESVYVEGTWSNDAGDDANNSVGKRSKKGDGLRSYTGKAADGYNDGCDFDVKKRASYSEKNGGQNTKNDYSHTRERNLNMSDAMKMDIEEKEKMWCYQDPTGKVQGPFSLEQLRRWEKTNLFPTDLRVWRATDSQDAGIYLTDALFGKRDKVLQHGFAQQEESRANNLAGIDFGLSDNDRVFKHEEAGNIQRRGCHYSTQDASRRGSNLDDWAPCDGQERNRHGNWGHVKVSSYSKQPDVIGNAGRFPTSKKDCPCRYFARGMCSKGQHCEFKH